MNNIEFHLYDYYYLRERASNEEKIIKLSKIDNKNIYKSWVFDINSNKTTKTLLNSHPIRLDDGQKWFYYEVFMEVAFGKDWKEKFNKGEF